MIHACPTLFKTRLTPPPAEIVVFPSGRGHSDDDGFGSRQVTGQLGPYT